MAKATTLIWSSFPNQIKIDYPQGPLRFEGSAFERPSAAQGEILEPSVPDDAAQAEGMP